MNPLNTPLTLGQPRSLLGWWNDFWFRPADPTVLCFLRVCTGLVLVYVLAVTTPLLDAFYGPDGMLTRETMNRLRKDTPWMPPESDWPQGGEPPIVRYRPLADSEEIFAYRRTWYVDPSVVYARGMPQFSPFFHLTSSRWVLAWHLLALGVAVLYLLGLWARVTGVLAWVLVMGYTHRAAPALFGMDTMMAILLFYLMFAPSGAALSLDRLIARYRDARRAMRGGQAPSSPPPEPSVSANVVTRLLQVHFCIIYLASGASKLQGTAWWNGTAIWMTWSNYEFSPPRTELFTEALRWLTGHRWLWDVVVCGGAIFTLALEISFPFLVWYRRLRWVMLTGAVLLHTGIALMMGLTAFSLLMIVIAGAFIPPEALRWALEKVFRGPQRLWLAYSARQKVGVRLAAAVHAVDAWGQVALVDVSREGPLAAPRVGGGDEDGAAGYPALVRLARALRVLWPLAALTWLPRLGAPREREAVGA